MEALEKTLKLVDLAPALYSTAIVLGLLLRFGRAWLPWMNSTWTFFSAIGLGLIGGVLGTASGSPWRITIMTGLSLAAVVLVEQEVLERVANSGRLPKWIAPMDNQFAAGGPTVRTSVPAATATPPAAPAAGVPSTPAIGGKP